MKPKGKSSRKDQPHKQPDILGTLFVASAKLQGLGVLMSGMHEHVILNQDNVAYVIGQILLETATELHRLYSAIDDGQF